MTHWRSLAVLSVFLTGGAPGVFAQTTNTIGIGKSVSLDGLTATITALGLPASGLTSGAELAVVEVSKHNLAFELINSNGSTSSIFAATTSATQTLTFSLQISPTVGYPQAIGKANSILETTTGYAAFNCSTCSGLTDPALTSATFTSIAVTPSPLTDSLAIQKSVASPSGATQVSSSASGTFAVSNTFTVNETLTLNPGGKTQERLEFNVLALQLHTVPEPASATVLLVSLGGVLMARRRRSPR